MNILNELLCPKCESSDVVPIVYGLPMPELEARAIRGEVALGGCIVFDGAPDSYCARCGHRWKDERPLGLDSEVQD